MSLSDIVQSMGSSYLVSQVYIIKRWFWYSFKKLGWLSVIQQKSGIFIVWFIMIKFQWNNFDQLLFMCLNLKNVPECLWNIKCRICFLSYSSCNKVLIPIYDSKLYVMFIIVSKVDQSVFCILKNYFVWSLSPGKWLNHKQGYYFCI